MQATLDKYYRKSRGLSSSKNKFALKGPSKRLSTDEKLKSEPLDETQCFVSSQSSKTETAPKTSLTDNLCSTPTRSRQIEPVPNDVLTEISEDVSKTPSSRLLNEGRCATPTRSPATQTVLRKQLRLGEYSRVLRDSKRTESRKRTIDRCGDSETSPTSIRRSMNDIYASPKLRKSNMKVEITRCYSPVKRGTLKPRRLFDTSTVSAPQKNQSCISPSKLSAAGPAHRPQFSPRKLNLECVDYSLTEGEEALVLPRKYLDLEEMFHWIELVTKIRIGRREMVTFNMIRNDVRKGTRRRFTEEHLAQIKTVYPGAFDLSRQLVKLPMNREKSYELIINIPDHANNLEREKAFHDCLIEKTKIHHQKFLEQYNPTLQIPASEVKRWHREFNLNDVPDIEPIALPKPPSTNDVTLSAKDLLEKTHAITSKNKRLERGLSSTSEEKTDNEPPACPVLSQKIVTRQKSLKGVPVGLLEKIRAKEAAKHTQDTTQTPAEAKEAVMLSRLPDIAKILRVLFVKEKKSILPEELVLRVVGQSYKEKMPAEVLKEHLKLLSKHQPGWINSCEVDNKPYIRVSKDADMTRVLGRLQKLIESI